MGLVIGTKGSGKSTVAKRLTIRHEYVRIPFAKPLKDMLRAAGLTDEQLDGSLKETPCALLRGRTPRHAMQTLGTEWGRNTIHPELWTMLWLNAVRRAERTLVVADDVRFENEATAIRSLGGILVRVVRGSDVVTDLANSLAATPDVARSLASAASPNTHASETELARIQCDMELFNDVSIDDLHAAVDGLVNLVRGGVSAS